MICDKGGSGSKKLGEGVRELPMYKRTNSHYILLPGGTHQRVEIRRIHTRHTVDEIEVCGREGDWGRDVST